MEWSQVATIVSTLAALTAFQGLWISRALDRVYAAVDRIEARLGRIDERLDRVEGVVLRDLGERIARLEAARD
jgi:hypothetical protein